MPSKDINDTCKAIRDVWENITNDFIESSPGYYLKIECSYRSPQEQFELFKQGRELGSIGWSVVDKLKVVTNDDGTIKKSPHNYNPSRAIDVSVWNNQTGKVNWKTIVFSPLENIAKRYNLVWGGDFKSIKDYDHLEVKDYKNYTE